MHSTPKLPEVEDIPKCKNTDIDRYIGMPTGPPMVDLKAEMPSELCDDLSHDR